MARKPLATSTRLPSSKNHSSSEIEPFGSAIGDSGPYRTSRSAFSASSAAAAVMRPWTFLKIAPYSAAMSFMEATGFSARAAATRGLSLARFASSQGAHSPPRSSPVIAW